MHANRSCVYKVYTAIAVDAVLRIKLHSRCLMSLRFASGLLLLFSTLAGGFGVMAVQLPPRRPTPEVRRLGPSVVGIGPLRVDTAVRELRAPGRINQVTILEFLANTPGGMKAYESAITVDSDAAMLNAGLLLLGLDPARARVPTRHFDPIPPQGDPVELHVEWRTPAGDRRVRAEELMWNQVTNATAPMGPWVYTGSTMAQGQFLAEADGVLIGFVHSPAPLIENPGPIPARAYGELILNPKLGLRAGQTVTLVIKALDRSAKPTR